VRIAVDANRLIFDFIGSGSSSDSATPLRYERPR
jgi:hypothetical protein